jgi:hypothetical protein
MEAASSAFVVVIPLNQSPTACFGCSPSLQELLLKCQPGMGMSTTTE